MVALEAALLHQWGSAPSLQPRIEALEIAMSTQLSIGQPSTPASAASAAFTAAANAAPATPDAGPSPPQTLPAARPPPPPVRTAPPAPAAHAPKDLNARLAAAANHHGAAGVASTEAAAAAAAAAALEASAPHPTAAAELLGSSVAAVLGLDETLCSILSHLDARGVGHTAAVASNWAAAAHATLSARRMLFIFGSIDVFAPALLRPSDGATAGGGSSRGSPGGAARSLGGSPGRGGSGGGGGGRLFTTSDGFLCCSEPLLLIDDTAAEEEGCAGSAVLSMSRVPTADAANFAASLVGATPRPTSSASTASTASIRGGGHGGLSRPSSAAVNMNAMLSPAERLARASEEAAAAAEVRACLTELRAVYGGTDYCLLLTHSGRVLSFGTAGASRALKPLPRFACLNCSTMTCRGQVRPWLGEMPIRPSCDSFGRPHETPWQFTDDSAMRSPQIWA